MPARCILFVIAILTLGWGTGCGERDGAPLIMETDEPFYVQGVQLKRQGRSAEALTAFLKVIDKRGLRAAPESHLEAGEIYLNHSKDPIAASFHFRKYLELQPNSKQTPHVRGMVEAARREFAKTIPGRPLEDQSVQLQANAEINQLRRDNQELRAELATLRGGGAVPIERAPRSIALPQDPRLRSPPPVAAVIASPITPVGPGANSVPALIQPAPTAVSRPGLTPAPAPAAKATAGRTHKVQPKETLYGISTRYYGHGRNVDAIFEANRDVMRSTTDLKIGMTLKIPAMPADGRR